MGTRIQAKKDQRGNIIGLETVNEDGVVLQSMPINQRTPGQPMPAPDLPATRVALPSTPGDYRSPAERRAEISFAERGSGRGGSGDDDEEGGYYVPDRVRNAQSAPPTDRGGSSEGGRPESSGTNRDPKDAGMYGPAFNNSATYTQNALLDEELDRKRKQGGFFERIGAGIQQTGRNVARGVVDAVEDVSDFGSFVLDKVRGVEVNYDDNWFNPSQHITEASSSGGKFLSEAVSFGVTTAALGAMGGTALVSKIPVIAKLGTTGWKANAAREAVLGMGVDFIKAKQGEENLYNAVEGTALETPLSRFFAADTSEEANEWMNKTKEAVGGAPLGVAFDLFSTGVGKAWGKLMTDPIEKYARGIKAAKDLPEEAQAAAIKTVERETAAVVEKNQKLLAAAIESDIGARITDARRLLKAADDTAIEVPPVRTPGLTPIDANKPTLNPNTGKPYEFFGDVAETMDDIERLSSLEENMVILEDYRKALKDLADQGASDYGMVNKLDDFLFKLDGEVSAIVSAQKMVDLTAPGRASIEEMNGVTKAKPSASFDPTPIRQEIESIDAELESLRSQTQPDVVEDVPDLSTKTDVTEETPTSTTDVQAQPDIDIEARRSEIQARIEELENQPDLWELEQQISMLEEELSSPNIDDLDKAEIEEQLADLNIRVENHVEYPDDEIENLTVELENLRTPRTPEEQAEIDDLEAMEASGMSAKEWIKRKVAQGSTNVADSDPLTPDIESLGREDILKLTPQLRKKVTQLGKEAAQTDDKALVSSIRQQQESYIEYLDNIEKKIRDIDSNKTISYEPKDAKDAELKEFAEDVIAEAKQIEGEGRFGEDKLLIAAVWDRMKTYDDFDMSLDEFKAKLQEANKADWITLSRADLGYSLDDDLVARSATDSDPTKAKNFIRTDHERRVTAESFSAPTPKADNSARIAEIEEQIKELEAQPEEWELEEIMEAAQADIDEATKTIENLRAKGNDQAIPTVEKRLAAAQEKYETAKAQLDEYEPDASEKIISLQEQIEELGNVGDLEVIDATQFDSMDDWINARLSNPAQIKVEYDTAIEAGTLGDNRSLQILGTLVDERIKKASKINPAWREILEEAFNEVKSATPETVPSSKAVAESAPSLQSLPSLPRPKFSEDSVIDGLKNIDYNNGNKGFLEFETISKEMGVDVGTAKKLAQGLKDKEGIEVGDSYIEFPSQSPQYKTDIPDDKVEAFMDAVYQTIKEAGENDVPIYQVAEKFPEMDLYTLHSYLYAAQREGKIELNSLHDQGSFTDAQMHKGILQSNGGYLFSIVANDIPTEADSLNAAAKARSISEPEQISKAPTPTVDNSARIAELEAKRAELEAQLNAAPAQEPDADLPIPETTELPPDFEPTPGREPVIIGGEGVGRQEAISKFTAPNFERPFEPTPGREPSLRGGEDLVQEGRVGEPNGRFRTKQEIRKDVGDKTVAKRVNEVKEKVTTKVEEPAPKPDTEVAKTNTEAPTPVTETDISEVPTRKPIAKLNAKAARKIGVSKEALNRNIMAKQSDKDVDRFLNMDILGLDDAQKEIVREVMDSVPAVGLLDDVSEAKTVQRGQLLAAGLANLTDKQGRAVLQAYAGNTANLPTAQVAVRMMVSDMAKQLQDINRSLGKKKLADYTTADHTLRSDAATKISQMFYYVRYNKNLGKVTAQGLRARGFDIDDKAVQKAINAVDYEDFHKAADKMTEPVDVLEKKLKSMQDTPEGREAMDMILKDIEVAKTPAEVAAAVELGKFSATTFASNTWSKTRGFIQGLRMNNILSGTTTNLGNFSSNAIMSAYVPATQMAGSAINMSMDIVRGRGIRSEDVSIMRQSVTTLVGLQHYIRDSAKMARRAFVTGEAILSPDLNMADLNRAGIEKLSNLNDFTSDGIGNMVNTSLNMPARLLMTGDELFKQVNYRAHVFAKAQEIGMERGLKGKKLREFMELTVDKSLGMSDPDSGLRGLGLDKDSLEYAEFVTFQTKVNEEMSNLRYSIGGGIDFLQKNPVGKAIIPLFIPFKGTPMNILAYSARNSPIGIISKQYRQDFAGGGIKAARAKGEFALGTSVLGGLIYIGMQGRLIGDAPKDPAERELFYASGKRPYSLKVGNKYISFERMEPYSSHMAVVADVMAVINRHEESLTPDVTSMMAEVAIAFAGSMKNEMYFKGFSDLTDLIDALGDLNDERNSKKVKDVSENIAATLLPYQSFFNEQRRGRDSIIRDARGLVEKVKNKIPGLSESIPAKRFWLTGEPLKYSDNPVLNMFPSSEYKGDPVIDKLIKYNIRINPPEETIQGVRLDAQQYSKYVELMGNLELDGKTLYQAFQDELNAYDPSFTQAEMDYLMKDEDYATEQPIYSNLNSIKKTYQDYARAELIQMYPELYQGIMEKVIKEDNEEVGLWFMNSPLYNAEGPVNEQEELMMMESMDKTNKTMKNLVEP